MYKKQTYDGRVIYETYNMYMLYENECAINRGYTQFGLDTIILAYRICDMKS